MLFLLQTSKQMVPFYYKPPIKWFHWKRRSILPDRETYYCIHIHIWRPGGETTTNCPKFKWLSISSKKELFIACVKHDLILFRAGPLLPAWESEVTGNDSRKCWWLSEWHTWYLVRAENTALKYPSAPSNKERKVKGMFVAVVRPKALSWVSPPSCLPALPVWRMLGF